MEMNFVSLFLIALLTAGVLAEDDATKNHRLEKRQDDSFLFFGGWRPMKSRKSYYHGSATGKYHDLISALPDSLDASSSYYTHALPSNYYKDIYNYYPKPAIKTKPKKNTPVYMEKYKPQRQQFKHGGSSISSGHPQIIDIQKLDLKQIQGLHDILLQSKELPLSQLNLHNNKGGKGFDIIEISLQNVPQGGHKAELRNRYNRNREPQRNNKGSYSRVPQHVSPMQLPLQYQYIRIPKVKTLMPQVLPKEISVSPVKLPHTIPSIEEILGIKNIQVVEVPVPASIPLPIRGDKNSRGSQYGIRNKAYNQAPYHISSLKSPQKVSFPANTYYAHQAEQPRKHYAPPQQAKSGYNKEQQPHIEAELVKLSEGEIQHLLKNIHAVNKNSQEFLKIIPIAEAAHQAKPEQLHVILALPQGDHGAQNVEISSYESRNHGNEQGNSYGNKEEYTSQIAYSSHGSTSISKTSGGYQVKSQDQAIEHNAAGYQINKQHEQPYAESYQNIDDNQDGYGRQNIAYQKIIQNTDGQQEYGKTNYNLPSQQEEVHNQQEQYIEVISTPSDDGYRREPVLAVEIHKGQTIEDAIKAIDPETLQRLGAHSKDGLEIEVVEVPLDEYSSESKKAETYVANTNSTTEVPKTKKTTTTSVTVTTSKSKVTEKKS